MVAQLTTQILCSFTRENLVQGRGQEVEEHKKKAKR